MFLVKNKQKSAKNVKKIFDFRKKSIQPNFFSRRECCQKVIFSRKNGFDKFQEDLTKGSREIRKCVIFFAKNP